MSTGVDKVQCDFCAFKCVLKEGESGRCGVRVNRGGTVESAYPMEFLPPRVEPVEKKPLYHFFPGSMSFSLGAFGCNFRCSFCQNYHLVHKEYHHSGQYRRYSKDEIENLWREAGKPPVAFTYSEPAVWQDSVLEIAAKLNQDGGESIMVSNGFYSDEACLRLMEEISAFNIDLKGPADFYPEYCRGSYKPVLKNIRRIADSPAHVLEVTTLVIEALHSRESIVNIGKELEDAGVQVWHLSLFHPAFRLSQIAPTSPDFVTDIIDEFRDRGIIPYIYLGNAAVQGYSDSLCPSCGELLIQRKAYRIHNHVRPLPQSPSSGKNKSAECPSCGKEVYGVFSR